MALPGSGSVLSVRASGLYRVPSVTVGLRACSPARPRHPASLPICVPSVERLPATLSRRLLAETTWRFGYGWRHYPRREPFIPIDQTPAGHTSAGLRPGNCERFPGSALVAGRRFGAVSMRQTTSAWRNFSTFLQEPRSRFRFLAVNVKLALLESIQPQPSGWTVSGADR